MKNLRKIKGLTLIIAIIIPMMMVFSTFLTTARADTYIDVENYGDDQWHWGVDEGDKIMFEIEFVISDPGTGSLIQQFKDLMIFNISSIENVTKLVSGLELVFSQVNSTRLYYNSSLDTLEPLNDDTQIIAEFALNNSHPTEYHYMTENNVVPLLLPLNKSGDIEWENMTNILDETMYTYLADYNFSRFDAFGFNSAEDSFWCKNTTHGYYINASYYTSDGTIKEAKGSVITPGDDDEPMMLNFTAVRVFDYNITEDVVWGVDVGDTFIYDFTEKHFDNTTYSDDGPIGGEIKMEISEINDTTLWIERNDFGDEDDTSPMVFKCVYADVYFWNISSNDFVLEMDNYLIGAANNFYPVLIRDGPQFIIPISANQTDFEYMFNPEILQNRGMPFDESSIVWGTSIIHFEMWNSTGSDMVKVRINATNGVFMNYLMSSEWDFTYYELKNMTFIDWAVDVGDYFYFKEFGGEGEREIRVTIAGFGYFFDNLSRFFEEFAEMPLPAGQPELQFFSVVLGIVHHWDREMEMWIPEYDQYNPPPTGGPAPGPKIRPIAAANKYWAIAPQMLSEGPPILLPNGTTGYDPEFQNLFDLMGFMYDDISYGLDWAYLSNSTANTHMQYNFSATTGMTTLIRGWMYNYDDYLGHFTWDFFSAYLETSIDLVTGLNTIPLLNLFSSDLTITAKISVSGPGAEFIYALNSINPVNVDIPLGDVLGYLDLKITNHSLLTANITLIIEFPSYVDLNTYYPYFWGWNMDMSHNWNGAPQELYDAIIYNSTANSVKFELPMEGPLMILVGLSYGTEPPLMEPGDFNLTSNAGTPDEDGDFELSWTISEGANSYSVYVSPFGCITDLSSLVPLASNLTVLTYSVTSLPNGTYYFVVVANNLVGDTFSNCLEVVVGSGVFEEIPGYNLLIVIVAFVSVSAIIIKKRRKL